MRDAQGLAPPGYVPVPPPVVVRRRRIAPALLVAAILAGLACYVVPRGLDANTQLTIEDDPSQIAARALDQKFDAAVAEREIEAALVAKDADLANSFVELAGARKIVLDPALTAKVNAAVVDAASTQRAMESFAMGLATGEPNDIAGFAGTALGDLFVFGDIRDAVREGGVWPRASRPTNWCWGWRVLASQSPRALTRRSARQARRVSVCRWPKSRARPGSSAPISPPASAA